MFFTRAGRQFFLRTAWGFVLVLLLGTIVGWLAALPVSNGQHGNTHNVGSQAVYGNGTALGPPLFITLLVGLCVLAATRNTGWLGKLGALLTFLFAGFFVSAGELGELTTDTSPLTGTKWHLVVALGAVEIAVAAVVALAAGWMAIGALTLRFRQPPREEATPASAPE